MSEAGQRITYAKGMLQGRQVGDQEGLQAVLTSVLEALEALHTEVDGVRRELEELSGYLQAVDDDLFEVEADLYGYDEAEMAELECPHCQTPLVVEAEFLDDDAAEVTCPECGYVLHRGPAYSEPVTLSTGGENGQPS